MLRSLSLVKRVSKTGGAVLPCLTTAVRNAVICHHHYKPGPYPRTHEERKAAAAKYGIPLEQYEAYPDDGCGHGDYPKFKVVPVEQRDPNYPWDEPKFKINYQETIHVDEMVINDTRVNLDEPQQVPIGVQAAFFFGTMGLVTILYFTTDEYLSYHPSVMEKQYPGKGSHYFFPPSADDTVSGH